jgi:hypothetical protein
MNATSETWLEIVRRKAAQMRFGSVHVTIHEGRVTLVEATERTRLPSEPPDRHAPEDHIHSASHRTPGARA